MKTAKNSMHAPSSYFVQEASRLITERRSASTDQSSPKNTKYFQ